MAKPTRKMDSHPIRMRQVNLDMFWKEFESIEPNVNEPAEEDDEHLNELEQNVEWLKEAGFDSMVKRYRDSKEINADDIEFQNITSSLTRKQADAVRRRVNTLNANVKERLSSQESSSGPHLKISFPENCSSRPRSQHADIRSIFPTQTVGEPSNKGQPNYASRRSYSEGVPLMRSEPVMYPHLRTSRSQEHLKEEQASAGPVKVITTGSSVQTQLVNRPPMVRPRNRTPSPKTKRESASYAMQLTGKGVSGQNQAQSMSQGQLTSSGAKGRLGARGSDPSRKFGGSLFYITAVSNATSESPTAPDKMKELALSDNWELSPRANSDGETAGSVSTPEQEFRPSDHSEITEQSFKEEPVVNDKPTIEFQKSENDYESPPKFPVLPNFTLTRDDYGITRIEDLSAEDMEKVRSLALIELTALFDSNNLVFNRRKPTKRKTKDYGVFGVPLLYLVQRDRGDKPKFHTPVILEEMIAFLENNGIKEEGILRVPGSAARVRNMREEIEEKFPETLFSWSGRKPHDVAALLKLFLRELPFPLLTYEYQPTFASVEDIPDRVQQLQALNLLVLLLPQTHRETLRLLLLFLCHVITRRKENKMDLNNVAMIMAPNLFLNTGNKSRATLREVEMAKGTINIVRMLIKYHAILWTVPSFMVRQVRFLYEVEHANKTKESKGKKRKAKRAASSDQTANSVQLKKSQSLDELDRTEQEYENHIIRVKAPSLNKVAMAVQLETTTKARDVVVKFCKGSTKWKDDDSSKNSSRLGHQSHKGNRCPCGNNHFLYEVGGNIGERCLDFETNLLQLSRLNPHAEWVVKVKD